TAGFHGGPGGAAGSSRASVKSVFWWGRAHEATGPSRVLLGRGRLGCIRVRRAGARLRAARGAGHAALRQGVLPARAASFFEQRRPPGGPDPGREWGRLGSLLERPGRRCPGLPRPTLGNAV